MQPFWQSNTMYGESVLCVRAEAQESASADLLFTPRELLHVQDSSGSITYEPGKDYALTPGAYRLVVPPGSRIPVKAWQELTPPKGSQPYSLIRRDGTGDILFGASHEYHDMQVLVTYSHAGDEWLGPVPSFAGEQLPRTWRRLVQREPLYIVLFGDSISTGCNASRWANTPPYQPFYADLLVQRLQAAYGGPVTLENFSVGGMDSAWGVANISPVVSAHPHLVILAFGMNDSTGGCPAAQYIANTQQQMQAVQAVHPQAEFILVASMLSNADWHIARPERLLEYRDALLALSGPGVAVADVTSVWVELLKRKKYLDITGNGVNHPNDFGHRLYADVLTALLTL
ncbi:MAG: SGNH/GDSL hydrolase family protein [Chloroflexi bacterium]|nr:SGNH/GDSL hydrolase family protein [Chloroflexota bacterium]